MRRSTLFTALLFSAVSLALAGCTQDFDQFEPQGSGPTGSGAGAGSSTASGAGGGGGGAGGGGQASCDDGVMNGDEKEVDCGGPCLRCNGEPCKGDGDCKSGNCTGHPSNRSCQPP